MKKLATLLTGLSILVAAPAMAQTTVKDAWIRGTVPQQKSSGLFLQITSQQGGRLVAASTPLAGVTEIHEMKMDGDVMKMRALPTGLALPAGKEVSLSPSGYHVMLLELRQQLKAGDIVPVTLVVENGNGQREQVEVKATVRELAGGMHMDH